MHIIYVGNRTNLASDGKPFNTEEHVYQTLLALGHNVTFIQESDIKPGTLADRVNGADMFLHTRTWHGKVTLQDLTAIKQRGIPTVSFHLDKYTGIRRDGGLGSDPFWHSDYVFSPEGSAQAKAVFKQHGINQFYLPPAVYEPECYFGEKGATPEHDIVFVGGGVEYAHPEWPYRAKLVRWLQATYGRRFTKYGHPQKLVRGADLNNLYANTKIVIGDSLCKDFMDSFYWSDRLTESVGRGAFMIHPYIPGITDILADRKEVVYYGYDNFMQLRNLIDYYLTHDSEREAIRIRGQDAVKRQHTYTQRMKQLIAIVELEEAKHRAKR